MREPIIKIVVAFLVLAKLSACAHDPSHPTPSPTVETIEISQKLNPAQKSSLTDQLAMEAANLAPIKFERMVNGFTVNGHPYTDSDGTIVDFSADSDAGQLSYIVKSNEKRYLIKHLQFGNEPRDTQLAHIRLEHPKTRWFVSTANGIEIEGDQPRVTSDGFLMMTDGKAMRYQIGQGLSEIPLPAGYTLANFQPADPSSTAHVLLERTEPQARHTSLIDKIKSAGSLLRLNTKLDYALLDMTNNTLHLINLPRARKVSIESEGCKQNVYFKQCELVPYIAPRYDEQGQAKKRHYYWRIRWIREGVDTYLLTQEGALSTLMATHLENGEKVRLFERALSISQYQVDHSENGKIRVTANLGISTQSVEDLQAEFNQL